MAQSMAAAECMPQHKVVVRGTFVDVQMMPEASTRRSRARSDHDVVYASSGSRSSGPGWASDDETLSNLGSTAGSAGWSASQCESGDSPHEEESDLFKDCLVRTPRDDDTQPRPAPVANYGFPMPFQVASPQQQQQHQAAYPVMYLPVGMNGAPIVGTPVFDPQTSMMWYIPQAVAASPTNSHQGSDLGNSQIAMQSMTQDSLPTVDPQTCFQPQSPPNSPLRCHANLGWSNSGSEQPAASFLSTSPVRERRAAKPKPQSRIRPAEKAKPPMPVPPVKAEHERTTVMLRNLPCDYSRDQMVSLLNAWGFRGKYDFVYLPVDYKRAAGLGYAFVNLRTHDDAINLWKNCDGFSDWKLLSQKVLTVSWSEPLQGFDAHVERYRNSPVMHETVPEECRPLIFDESGARCPFPAPTQRIRAPRFKQPVQGQ